MEWRGQSLPSELRRLAKFTRGKTSSAEVSRACEGLLENPLAPVVCLGRQLRVEWPYADKGLAQLERDLLRRWAAFLLPQLAAQIRQALKGACKSAADQIVLNNLALAFQNELPLLVEALDNAQTWPSRANGIRETVRQATQFFRSCSLKDLASAGATMRAVLDFVWSKELIAHRSPSQAPPLRIRESRRAKHSSGRKTPAI